MPRPFEGVRGRLLAAGIAPSHVHRYLAELTDHLDDLVAEGLEAGRNLEEARAAALVRLGADQALAGAMIAPGRFRSWTARAPWVVLPAMGLGILAAAYGLTVLMLIAAVAGGATVISGHPMPPGWLPPSAELLFVADRFLVPVLAGWGIGALALRQRLDTGWTAVAMTVVAVVGAALYCRADWPLEPRPWSFRVGSQLDDEAPFLSWGSYSALVSATLLAIWLPYTSLRRVLLSAGWALCIVSLSALGGCASSPPSAEELIRRFAENRSAESSLSADTPEDAVAMDRAAAEIRAHLATLSPPPVPTTRPRGSDGILEVTVTASHNMAGNWHLVSPTQVHIRAGAPDSWGNVRNFLCRFEQEGETVTGSCLPERRSMRGTLRGDELHFGWTTGLIRADIDGRLVSPTDFAGDFSLGTLGLDLVKTDVPAYGSKIAVLPPAPEGADSEAAFRFSGLSQPAGELGGMRGFSYLGSVDLPADPVAHREAVPMLVYDVEFDHGWELCGFTRSTADVVCR